MPKLTSKGVQITLALLWLLDGLLQLQRPMFTSAFVKQIILPASLGQPGFVKAPMQFGSHVFLLDPVIFNTLFVLLQLTIGLLILWRRSLKLGLGLSVVWGLIVWVFGEGYGGLLTGHSLLLMGAPGAAIIYAILALAVWQSQSQQNKTKHGTAFWLVFVWLIIWFGGGIYQLLPGQNSATSLAAMVQANAQGQPAWLASLDTSSARLVASTAHIKQPLPKCQSGGQTMSMTGSQMAHMTNESCANSAYKPGYWLILLLTLLQFAIGLAVLIGQKSRQLAIYLGLILSLVFWLVGQSLGGLVSGLTTDPNSGPLIIILGLAILGIDQLDLKLTIFSHKIQTFLIGSPK